MEDDFKYQRTDVDIRCICYNAFFMFLFFLSLSWHHSLSLFFFSHSFSSLYTAFLPPSLFHSFSYRCYSLFFSSFPSSPYSTNSVLHFFTQYFPYNIYSFVSVIHSFPINFIQTYSLFSYQIFFSLILFSILLLSIYSVLHLLFIPVLYFLPSFLHSLTHSLPAAFSHFPSLPFLPIFLYLLIRSLIFLLPSFDH